MTHISEAMRGALGAVLDRRVSYPVAESDIRRWAIAVYYPDAPPARFLDPAADIVAPEEFNAFAWCVAKQETTGTGDVVHLEKSLGIPPPRVNFALNGGMEVEYGEPIRPGDVLTAVKRLTRYDERSGRLGRMLFTTLEDTWTNQRAERVRRHRTTLIRY
ncbi:FAS1-like dehydratase domain-containing protein [Amycolatopsis jejuensis]|uniref:FAS1-like dehydratase domain-containing protein n=1 Tax=Amycolatopsis jejuensis TaxID=330084 RepID=UPI000525E4CC|nr:MaoC family dehydratase N-terminal domain-containing protein [Amycolatopsis jejuensis]